MMILELESVHLSSHDHTWSPDVRTAMDVLLTLT